MADPVTFTVAAGQVAQWWGAISGSSLTPRQERDLRAARATGEYRPVKGGFIGPDGKFISTRDVVRIGGAIRAGGATPGINPNAPPPTAPTQSSRDLLGVLLNRPVTTARAPRTESEFDRLIRGRTFLPRGGTVADRQPAPVRYPTRTGAGYYQAEAYFSLGQWAQRELRRLLDQRRLRRQRKGPRRRPRIDGVPPQTPGPLDSAPKTPAVPKRARVAPTVERPAAHPPARVVVRREPSSASPDRAAIDLPQVILRPGTVVTPRPARVPTARPSLRSTLKTLPYALIGLPLLRPKLDAKSSSRPRAALAPVPGELIRPEMQALTASQGSGGNSRCECKQTRSRGPSKPRCRNPVVKKRTFVNRGRKFQTVTRELQCPV